MSQSSSPLNTLSPPASHITTVDQAGGVIALLGSIGLAASVGWLLQRKPGWLVLSAASQSALAGVFWLFRNPSRSNPAGAGLVVSPCDGEVRKIDLVHEPRFVKALTYRVTIQIRPGDVQVTRSPSDGRVRYRRYQPGGQQNEHNDTLWIGIHHSSGVKVLIKQRASSFWRAMPAFVGRRITTLLDLEDAAQQGQVMGHLPLGGEVQIFIPDTAHMAVTPGTRVRAGETILARP